MLLFPAGLVGGPKWVHYHGNIGGEEVHLSTRSNEWVEHLLKVSGEAHDGPLIGGGGEPGELKEEQWAVHSPSERIRCSSVPSLTYGYGGGLAIYILRGLLFSSFYTVTLNKLLSLQSFGENQGATFWLPNVNQIPPQSQPETVGLSLPSLSDFTSVSGVCS